MEQRPYPGQHILAFCGDILEFDLTLPETIPGHACLRTNIGHAATHRLEIIREAQEQQPRLAEDWFDIPMVRIDEHRFRLRVPVLEPGHFEAKAFFLPEHSSIPAWPDGPNTVINVHPAEYCCANSLYNAFVRQFGQEKTSPETLNLSQAKTMQTLKREGFAVIPPSGTFRDLIRQLDHIVDRLRCRILMLLPIHPTPTVYGRMGTFGSPYAALDFMEVDPALAEFDKKATPLEQFLELTDAVHAKGARLFLDIAINHTGWASNLHTHHPDWLTRDPDGTIRSPGAWGTVWEDLTELNHHSHELWQYLSEVFVTWCRRGVDGFRCDAGYMIPLPAWEYIIAVVRREFPDTIFLLEGLGGAHETTQALLNIANLNWAYSELFQNFDRTQIDAYLPPAIRTSETDGVLMHFAETHDNTRLAARSIPYARMRTALAALCSHNGAFAFANGVEWFATERVDVHERRSLNWGSAENQIDWITRLNAILQLHPAFWHGAQLRLVHTGGGNSLALLRESSTTPCRALLVLINLTEKEPQHVVWPADMAGLDPASLIDLLSGKAPGITVKKNQASVTLAPADALCLTADAGDLRELERTLREPAHVPQRVQIQCLRAKALDIMTYFRCLNDTGDTDANELAARLATSPHEFCRAMNPAGDEDRVVAWNWPQDMHREVMIPRGHLLHIQAPHPFRVRLSDADHVLRQENAIQQADGRFFVILIPPPHVAGFYSCTLKLWIFTPAGTLYAKGRVLFLPAGGAPQVPVRFRRADVLETHPVVLSTNGRGAMMRAGVRWADLRSRYEALLAGNLSTEFPEDRHIMLTRCRAWLVFQSYSQYVSIDRLHEFVHEHNGGLWRFRIPFGHAHAITFDIHAELVPDRNAVRLTFHRHRADASQTHLADSIQVQLIVRPGIEDRNFHTDTKAYAGPDKQWPDMIQPETHGFTFTPDPTRKLKLTLSSGTFQTAPEWDYMIHHPVEASRGLEPHSDLFSPGYFDVQLKGGESTALLAQIITPAEPDALPATIPHDIGKRAGATDAELPLLDVLHAAMSQFVVRRGNLKTVIAGYPWFLDWGRDTLICARGLIAGGLHDEVRAILRQFATFEQDGTLPNLIHGQDASNRDTTDAPLWFVVACADWCRTTRHHTLLNDKCGQRTVRQVIESIVRGYMRGTPNGIRMDSESGLIFSPAHFTWMDTNHPMGTPRMGYPIEIQSLWFAAVRYLAELENTPEWHTLASRIQASMMKYFWNPDRGYFSDCLHATAGQSAAQATADDALRPNQLLALTLGVVKNTATLRRTLTACAELLIPGAIRTLADRPVAVPLPIYRDGTLINDPLHPYWGRYEGDEDTRRKPAYHNGTAWTWLFPSYCEAWMLAYGPEGRHTAQALLSSSLRIVNRGCLGQIPEIIDGNVPHELRGCDAQAWGVTELYRVLKHVLEFRA